MLDAVNESLVVHHPHNYIMNDDVDYESYIIIS